MNRNHCKNVCIIFSKNGYMFSASSVNVTSTAEAEGTQTVFLYIEKNVGANKR